MERKIITMDDLSPEIIKMIQSEYMDTITKKLFWPQMTGVYVTKLNKNSLLTQILAQIAELEIVGDDRKKLISELKNIKSAIQYNLNGIAKNALKAAGINPYQEMCESIEYWNEGSPVFGILLPENFNHKEPNEFIVHENQTGSEILEELERMCGPFERTENGLYLDSPFVKIHKI